MNSISLFTTTPDWHAVSATNSKDAVSKERSALAQHLDACKKSSGRMFSLRCKAEVMHGFLASRFVTTLALIAVTIGISAFVF